MLQIKCHLEKTKWVRVKSSMVGSGLGVTKEGLNRLSTEDFNGGELSCNHAHMTLWICQTQHKEGSLVYINFL